MNLKKITLTYLVSYLVGGGICLLTVPGFFLKILQSNQDYGDVMPRFAGVFMLALGCFVGMILYYKDYKYYRFSIVIRTIIVAILIWFYISTKDPFFIVVNIIVLIGLIPSYVAVLNEKKQDTRPAE
ncbi:MAG: hypothetical protein OEQ53_11390 [Saprospiraceae bacterium]|nr:hypothetical protein [Saprospiraceae bacterium]